MTRTGGGPAAVLVILALLVLAIAALVSAQTPARPALPAAPAPVLSETDRLKVINASLLVENATLKVQAAAGELQKARGDFDALVAKVTPAGWRLTEALEFVKVEKTGGGG